MVAILITVICRLLFARHRAWGCGKLMKGTVLRPIRSPLVQCSGRSQHGALDEASRPSQGHQKGPHPGADAWCWRDKQKLSKHRGVKVFLAGKQHEQTVFMD